MVPAMASDLWVGGLRRTIRSTELSFRCSGGQSSSSGQPGPSTLCTGQRGQLSTWLSEKVLMRKPGNGVGGWGWEGNREIELSLLFFGGGNLKRAKCIIFY